MNIREDTSRSQDLHLEKISFCSKYPSEGCQSTINDIRTHPLKTSWVWKKGFTSSKYEIQDKHLHMYSSRLPAPLSFAKQTCNLRWMSLKPRHRFLLKLLRVWCHNQHLYMRARARNKTSRCMFCYLLCFYASRHHNALVSSFAQSEKKNVEISGRKNPGSLELTTLYTSDWLQ